MKKNRNILDEWFSIIEENLECNLNEEDKQYSYSFENYEDALLELVNANSFKLAKNYLDNLEEEIFDSMKHFNKKYYFAGFLDAINIIFRI